MAENEVIVEVEAVVPKNGMSFRKNIFFPKQDEYGFWYYDGLPGNVRKAVASDFYNKEGMLKLGMPYLVESYHQVIFWAFRVMDVLTMAKLQPWLDDGKVFVFDEIKASENKVSTEGICPSVPEKISQLKTMIQNGYGRTGKPLPPKRMEKLKETLKHLEEEK